MADLTTILNDPNYVNANAATKAAIFLKYAPQDPNYANANEATKQAIHAKFGVESLGANIQETISTALGGNEPSEIPAPRAEPTTYEKIRPYVAPAVETLGAVGGAAAGIPLGPPGVVAGAGLGYGIGNELMYQADVAFGARKPRQGFENVTEPLTNVLTGSTFEAGGQVVAPIIGKVVGKAMDLRQIPQQRAAKMAQAALGNDMPQVINTLRNAPPNASVAELTANIENPLWQAFVQDALAKDSQFLRKMRLADDAQATNELSKLVGGTTATDVRGTLETAKSNLNAMTGPQRESALNRANLGQDVAAYEAQAGKLSAEAAAEVQKVRDLISAGNTAEAWARLDLIKRGLPVGATPYTNFGELSSKALNEWSSKAADASLDLGQGARFAQGAADALRSVGIKPLETAPLVEKITSMLSNPKSGIPGNDVLEGAIKNVANDLTKWTNKNGVIDAVALEAIRKNSVNAAIQQLRPGADATTQRNLAASVLSKIKPAIDDAIEAAGGVGWKDYLATHAQGMQRIAEKKLTGEALRLWKTDKDAFVRLVQNESPDAVEKILGPGNYNIATELADSTLTVLQNQAQKHLTKMSVKEQITEGQKALTQLVAQQSNSFRFPSWLNFWTTASNQALSELEKKIGAKSMTVLTQALKTPEGTANLLQTLPGAERSRVLQILSDPSVLKQGSKLYAPPGSAPKGTNAEKAAVRIRSGVSNMLAPENQNQNALTQ
jgi:hypothetical protein